MGNTAALKPWLGEGVYNKLAADIRTRKHDGIVFDTNILDIDENQIIMRFLENGGPVIVVVYMVQQINCIRNKKGEIIEVSINLVTYDLHFKSKSLIYVRRSMLGEALFLGYHDYSKPSSFFIC